jgi:hypothetical protein
VRMDVLEKGYVQVDETPIKYLSPGHGTTKLGYLWTDHRPGGDTVFDWQTRLAHPPASLLWAVSIEAGEFVSWCGGGWGFCWWAERGGVSRDSGQAERGEMFPPSPRGGERRGFGGGAPIRPVRPTVAAISRCFSSGRFLFASSEEASAPTGNLLFVGGSQGGTPTG